MECSESEQLVYFLSQLNPRSDANYTRFSIPLSKIKDLRLIENQFNAVLTKFPKLRSSYQWKDEKLVVRDVENLHYSFGKTESELSTPTAPISVYNDRENLHFSFHNILGDELFLRDVVQSSLIPSNDIERKWAIEPKQDRELAKSQNDSSSFWKSYLSGIDIEFDNGIHEEFAAQRLVLTKLIKKKTIQEIAKYHNCSILDILLTALVRAIRIQTGVEDAVIGASGSSFHTKNEKIDTTTRMIPLRFSTEYETIHQDLEHAKSQISRVSEYRNSEISDILKAISGDDASFSIYKSVFRTVISFDDSDVKSYVRKDPANHTIYEKAFKFHYSDEWLSLELEYARERNEKQKLDELLVLFRKSINRLLPGRKQYVSQPLQGFLVDRPVYKSLGRLFYEQATRTPMNLKITSISMKMSYGSGLLKVLAIANYIRRIFTKTYGRPPRPDDVISIELDETPQIILIIEAVHFIGCVYMCIDRNLPHASVLQVHKDCQPALHITEPSDKTYCVPVLHVPNDLPAAKSARYLCTSAANNLCFIICTSGSTGTPKGVPVDQQPTVNILLHVTKTSLYRAGGRMMQFNKHIFDGTVINTFGSLVHGGAIVSIKPDADVLTSILEGQPLTNLDATPLIFDLLDESDHSSISQVETWSTGGEAMPKSTLTRFITARRKLINQYGPTEATVYQTCIRMKINNEPNNIGKVIENVPYGLRSFSEAYPSRELKGQLLLGGENLARGYIANPEKTDKAFKTNRDRTKEDRVLGRNKRVYLTGDRIEEDVHGDMKFFGRQDDQVKLGGRKMHIADLEKILNKELQLENMVLINVQEDDVQVVIAFYSGSPSDETELIKKSAELVPQFAVPVAFINLEAFPRFPNGKSDKKKLKEMASGRRQKSQASDERMPSEMEQKIIEACKTTFSAEDINLKSNISTLAKMQPLKHIALLGHLEKIGISTDLSTVVKASSIEKLAKVLEASKNSARKSVIESTQNEAMSMNILDIAKDVLKKTDIVPSKSFFANGGNSLRAIQLIDQLEEAFDKELEASIVYEARSLSELAATVMKIVNPESASVTSILATSSSGKEPTSDVKGKVKENGLEPAKSTENASPTAKTSSSSQDPLASRLKDVWFRVLRHENFDEAANFFFVGGNSVKLLKLHVEINKEFKIKLTVNNLVRNLKFPDMMKLIRENMSPEQLSSFEQKSSNGQEPTKAKKVSKTPPPTPSEEPTLSQINGRIPVAQTKQPTSSAPQTSSAFKTTKAVIASVKEVADAVLKKSTDVNRNFFANGGNSLRILQFIDQLEEKFDMDLEASVVYEHSTLASYARYLATLLNSDQDESGSDPESSVIDGFENVSLDEADLIKVVHDPVKAKRTIVILHALYGGSTAYSHLIARLANDSNKIVTINHPNTFEMESKDDWCNSTIERLCLGYWSRVKGLIRGRAILIGASIGGTLAYEMSAHFEDSVVVAIDSAAAKDSIKNYTYEQHVADTSRALKEFELPDETEKAMIENSWSLLGMDKVYIYPKSQRTVHLMPIDGTDMGWKEFCNVQVHKLGGTHATMLIPPVIDELSRDILKIVEG